MTSRGTEDFAPPLGWARAFGSGRRTQARLGTKEARIRAHSSLQNLRSTDVGGDKGGAHRTPFSLQVLHRNFTMPGSQNPLADFMCSVCLQTLRTPTTLGCGHTFCRVCLVALIEVSRRPCCPECRGHMPANGVWTQFLYCAFSGVSGFGCAWMGEGDARNYYNFLVLLPANRGCECYSVMPAYANKYICTTPTRAQCMHTRVCVGASLRPQVRMRWNALPRHVGAADNALSHLSSHAYMQA